MDGGCTGELKNVHSQDENHCPIPWITRRLPQINSFDPNVMNRMLRGESHTKMLSYLNDATLYPPECYCRTSNLVRGAREWSGSWTQSRRRWWPGRGVPTCRGHIWSTGQRIQQPNSILHSPSSMNALQYPHRTQSFLGYYCKPLDNPHVIGPLNKAHMSDDAGDIEANK